jgi:hypothetical protein
MERVSAEPRKAWFFGAKRQKMRPVFFEFEIAETPCKGT